MALPSAPLTLRDFQREDVDRITEADHRALIASAPGTGKTIVCLSAIAEQGLRLLPALIVCPASVVFNWKIEARQWAPGVRVHCVEDTTNALDGRLRDTVDGQTGCPPKVGGALQRHGLSGRTTARRDGA
jgi:SNF2 family DNA or RNA helicase